jgi:hypothetical protein
MPYGGPIVDPFHRKGPDGRTYFDVLDPPRGLGQLYAVLVNHTRRFQAEAAKAQYPAAKAYWNGWRLAFRKGIIDLQRTMAKSAIEAAGVADVVATNVLKATQVRPDTTKQRHLEDTFLSRATPTGAVELGVAGLFDEKKLNQAKRGGNIYWEAQEFGTDAHVGRVRYAVSSSVRAVAHGRRRLTSASIPSSRRRGGGRQGGSGSRSRRGAFCAGASRRLGSAATRASSQRGERSTRCLLRFRGAACHHPRRVVAAPAGGNRDGGDRSQPGSPADPAEIATLVVHYGVAMETHP